MVIVKAGTHGCKCNGCGAEFPASKSHDRLQCLQDQIDKLRLQVTALTRDTIGAERGR